MPKNVVEVIQWIFTGGLTLYIFWEVFVSSGSKAKKQRREELERAVSDNRSQLISLTNALIKDRTTQEVGDVAREKELRDLRKRIERLEELAIGGRDAP